MRVVYLQLSGKNIYEHMHNKCIVILLFKYFDFIYIFYLNSTKWNLFRSKQIENVMLKVNDNTSGNNDIRESKYGINKELDSRVSNEEMIYQEYIICLKKHQLAIK